MKTSPTQQTLPEITSTLEAIEIIEKWYIDIEDRKQAHDKEVKDKGILEMAKQFLATHFGLTPQQALFLTAVFMITHNGEDEMDGSDEASIRQIAKKLNMVNAKLYSYFYDFDVLIEEGFLSTTNEINKIRQCLKIPPYIIDVILSNAPYIKSENKQTCLSLADHLKNQVEQIIKCSRGDIASHQLVRHLAEKYEKLSGKFPLMKYINDLNICTQEKILFFEACSSASIRDGKLVVMELAEILFNDQRSKREFIRKLSLGESVLVTEDLIDIDLGEFINELEVSLTEKALKMYLGDDVDLRTNKKQDKTLIAAEDVATRKLFFTEESQRQLSEFESVLDTDRFLLLQQRLSERGMNTGLTAMFYGGPGTGKTESVMQLAKRTGRDIVHVDISAAKSMWLGESEKLIKKVFVRYNALLKKGKVSPILLFNEADAIFNKRKTGEVRGAENALNAMQNIILEEMEKFKGILIATSNLVGNLDPAFERRFLFKIRLETPPVEIKQKIWADRLPAFAEDEFAEIARKYDFSGGEIDNIVRKLTMSEIIEGSLPTISNIEKLCQQERFSQSTYRPVGFGK